MRGRMLAPVIALAVTAVLAVVAADLPRFGSEMTPVRNEILARYVGSVRPDTGAVNSVTAIVFDYRGYDTLGEATVLFTAAVALGAVAGSGLLGTRPAGWAMRDLVLESVARNLIPFVLVYGAYVTTHGHLSPGGGFAGGTIAAAGLVLAVLVWGAGATGIQDGEEGLRFAEAWAMLSYVAIGAAAWLVGRPFLSNLGAGWPAGPAGSLLSSGAIWLLGAAICVKVAATITGVYAKIDGDHLPAMSEAGAAGVSPGDGGHA